MKFFLCATFYKQSKNDVSGLGAQKPFPQAASFPCRLSDSIGLSFQAYLAAFPLLLTAFLPYFEPYWT